MSSGFDAQSCLCHAEEIVDLKSKLRKHDDKRRQALNNILDIKGTSFTLMMTIYDEMVKVFFFFNMDCIIGSIRVFCRIRPYLLTNRRIMHQPISVDSNKIVIRSGGSKKEFEFDKVFTQEESQGQFSQPWGLW